MMYRPFLHVERLTSLDEDFLKGEVIITPKLDGTNAVLFLDDNGELACGSRKRQLSETKDNAGFFQWIKAENTEVQALKAFLNKHPSFILYGEWKVGTIGYIKDYKEEMSDHLWIFAVYDTGTFKYINPSKFESLFSSTHIRYVPSIAKVHNPSIPFLEKLAQDCSWGMKDWKTGEGIVVFNENGYDQYGHFQMGKLVVREQEQKIPRTKIENIEKEIVDEYLTIAELDKNYAKTTKEIDENMQKNRFIGVFMQLCWVDSILNEAPNWAKKFHLPIVDFKKLNSLVREKALQYLNIN